VWRAAKVVKKERKLWQAELVAGDEPRCHRIILKNDSHFRNLRNIKPYFMRAKTILMILILTVASWQAMGQKRARMVTVTGTVTDTTMSPVHGVLIIADGQSTGVVTGGNGTYSIRIRPDVKSLGVYSTNMGSALTEYEGSPVVDFVLDGRDVLRNFKFEMPEGEKEIEVAYGTVKKKNLTTDVGYIDGQAHVNSSYTNIYEMIKGKVPGVVVSGNKITIRGTNSILLSSDPLFVVDGSVVNSIDHINPRDVKSISVLKGSDAAIYGSRGAGGVILITLVGTKR
jgi:TonB-dependent SusC/RagA subfamily outer membrane receptor